MPLSPEDALRAFHAVRAGGAAAVFGGGRLADGQDSYQWLAAGLLPGRHQDVLDLGCGDGLLLALLRERLGAGARLTGLDMCPEELAQAAQRLVGSGARLIEARAQDLPLATASLDAVVSHLALMLMDDVADVLAQVRRVLRPGGALVAVLGRGGLDGSEGSFLALLRDLNTDDARRIAWSADRRIHSSEGIAALLDGWDDVVIADETLVVPVPVRDLWAFLDSAYYEVGLASPAVQDQLRRYADTHLAPLAVGGQVRWRFNLRRVLATAPA